MIAGIFALVFAATALCAEEYNFTASPAQTLTIREGQRKCVVVRQGKRLAEVYIFGRPGETGLLKLSLTPEGLTLDPTEYFKTVSDNPNLNLRAVFDLDKLKLAENITKSTLPNNRITLVVSGPEDGSLTLYFEGRTRSHFYRAKSVKLKQGFQSCTFEAVLPDTLKEISARISISRPGVYTIQSIRMEPL